MKATRIALVATALGVASAGSLESQARGRFTMPSKPPRQAVQPRNSDRPQPTPAHPHGPHASVPVAFTFLPAVIMSDGRVFADFGYGYEPVSRPCAPVAPVGVIYSNTPVSSAIPVVAGNGVSLSPVPTIQPAPQLTPRAGQSSTASAASQAGGRHGGVTRDACYRREPAGGVVIIW